MEDSAPCIFDKQRHVKYWQRCLKSLLPTDYTGSDSSRMLLGFLILAALDLLDIGVDKLPALERKGYADWVLSCQHPHGGFCGSPNHKYPFRYYNRRRDIDPAGLPATFFALINLGLVGKLDQVERVQCLKWLKRLQRDDGSFGELLQSNGKIGGGRDMRYSHFAAGVRWVLRGDLAASQGLCEDIDVGGLIRYIHNAQTYDGGFGETSAHESHGGYTYNAISASAFIGRLTAASNSPHSLLSPSNVQAGIPNVSQTIHWLLSRQLAVNDDDDTEDEDENPNLNDDLSTNHMSQEVPSLAALTVEDTPSVGCNGRCNKKADTCYCYWVNAALKILGKEELTNKEDTRRFLLEHTQHRIGGFGKSQGYPPVDVYHSYLGLALLAQMNEPGLKPLDSALCVSQQVSDNILEAVTNPSEVTQYYWKHGRDWDHLAGGGPDDDVPDIGELLLEEMKRQFS
ncbi:MAG: hypothetical protein M1818_001726 [Claussenomyces sp. TS43310]|nr:MAG: hypothetical protein M1818_001726 [Claussenomyces sp. TS43310]